MRFLRHPSRSPIGLDIGGRHVKAVQLERAHGRAGWRMATAAVFPRATPGAALEAAEIRDIADVLYRRGFTGNRAVIPVPAEKVIGGVLEVPARGAGIPVDQIARMELARTHRCPPDSFEMGYWDLPAPARAKSTSQIMAIGCPHGEAQTLLDCFESHGMDVVALDVRACAIARAAAPLVRSDAAISAILDLGWGSAMVVMLYGGAIVYSRSLSDAGTRSLHESLHKTLGLDSEVTDFLLTHVGLNPSADGAPADAPAVDLPPEARKLLAAYVDSIVQELTVSFSYVGHEYPDTPLAQLLLTGSSAAIPGLARHVSQVLHLEAKLIAPPDLVECAAGALESCSSSALVAAVGLAQFREGADA